MKFKPNKLGLLLPEIVHVDDVELVRKKGVLYGESEENKDCNRRVSGCKIIFPDPPNRCGFLLPNKYQILLDGSIFAIDTTYEIAIRDLFLNGRRFWNYNLFDKFDLGIREILSDPAKDFIRCAFWLLGDCLYDSESKWFSRDPIQYFFYKIMIYRFWYGQTFQRTSMGEQWRLSGLDKTEENVKRIEQGKRVDVWPDLVGKVAKEVVDDFRESEELQYRIMGIE